MKVIAEFGRPADPSHPATEEESRRIREHLEHLLADPLFSNSKRLPAFLRYVVKEALKGSADGQGDGQIKERTLGIMVFGRPADYDSNADPVVRMTAGEVRKKLAQYYYANQDSDLQIEVPLGSYMPRFRFNHPKPIAKSPHPVEAPHPLEAPQLAAPAPLAAVAPDLPPVSFPVPPSAPLPVGLHVRERSGSAPPAFAIAGVVVLAVCGFFLWRSMNHQSSVDRFWSSFSGSSKQVLIVLPALSRTPQAVPMYHFEAESVAIEDAEVATGISNELKSRHLDSHLMLATGASLSDLRSNPFVLIGAMDNVWTMRLSQNLPFAFERSADRRYGRIIDRKNPNVSWTEDFSIPNAQIPLDYGIIARFTDATTDQPTVLIAGISAEGTLAAGEAVTSPRYLDMLLQAAGSNHAGFEAVIETRVIDGRSGPPRVVAIHTW